MKKIILLFVAVSIVGLVSISSCKSSTKPAAAAESAVEVKVKADTLKQVVDSIEDADDVDTAGVVEE
jgi:hypothetical protein